MVSKINLVQSTPNMWLYYKHFLSKQSSHLEVEYLQNPSKSLIVTLLQASEILVDSVSSFKSATLLSLIFYYRPKLLDWIKLRGVRWEIDVHISSAFNIQLNVFVFLDRGIVHDQIMSLKLLVFIHHVQGNREKFEVMPSGSSSLTCLGLDRAICSFSFF